MVNSGIFRSLDLRNQDNDNKSAGFTIVELMIATMVFSVIMLVAAGAVVRFTSNFQRGITSSTTQSTARSVIDTISQSIQFSGSTVSPGSTSYCIGSTRYSYILGKQLDAAGQKHVLVEEKQGLPIGCGEETFNLSTNPDLNSNLYQELLAPKMRLAKFEITSPDRNGIVSLTIRIAYGDNDLLCAPSVGNCNNNTELTAGQFQDKGILSELQCKGQKGSQYCAVSEITTTVQSRV